jgi:hypothetical protein
MDGSGLAAYDADKSDEALFLDTIAAVFATGTVGFWLDRSLVSVGHNSISLCRSTERSRCDFERLYLGKSPGNLWDLYSFWCQCVFFRCLFWRRCNATKGLRRDWTSLRNRFREFCESVLQDWCIQNAGEMKLAAPNHIGELLLDEREGHLNPFANV